MCYIDNERCGVCVFGWYLKTGLFRGLVKILQKIQSFFFCLAFLIFFKTTLCFSYFCIFPFDFNKILLRIWFLPRWFLVYTKYMSAKSEYWFICLEITHAHTHTLYSIVLRVVLFYYLFVQTTVVSQTTTCLFN